MLTQSQKYVKIAFLTLILLLIITPELATAKKKRSKDAKSRWSGTETRQIAETDNKKSKKMSRVRKEHRDRKLNAGKPKNAGPSSRRSSRRTVNSQNSGSKNISTVENKRKIKHHNKPRSKTTLKPRKSVIKVVNNHKPTLKRPAGKAEITQPRKRRTAKAVARTSDVTTKRAVRKIRKAIQKHKTAVTSTTNSVVSRSITNIDMAPVSTTKIATNKVMVKTSAPTVSVNLVAQNIAPARRHRLNSRHNSSRRDSDHNKRSSHHRVGRHRSWHYTNSGFSFSLNLGSSYDRHHYVKRHHPRRIFRRTVWPKRHHAVYYNWGPHFTYRYVYPNYHRKYVFVSLNGYWPLSYRYKRYYWYGWHPYHWYGRYPVVYEVQGQTYNYYTYNYYDADDEPTYTNQSPYFVDFSDVRERLAAQAAEEPDRETGADRYFNYGVEAFEQGRYGRAVIKFGDALRLEPDDIVLPFAYIQALFAQGRYTKAAAALQKALTELGPDQQGVFYPRGLYTEDQVLFDQIEDLTKELDHSRYNADLQLLLGYQLLGAGDLNRAEEHLQKAHEDWTNQTPAEILLEILREIRTVSN